MLLSGPLMVGHFGKLRGVHGFVGAGLPSDFVDRWDNWYLMATRRTPLGAIAYDEPAWRFVAAAGLFGHFAAAGVWQRSQDCDGQIYPFVIAVLGASLADDDPWFDATQSLLTVVVDGEIPSAQIGARIATLPVPVPREPGGPAMLLWRDDWEVHELSFATGRDFAAYGLPGAV